MGHNKYDFTLLVAEDDLISQKILNNILCNYFSEISYARDGEEAYALFRSKNFDILLTDISMPKIDGITLIEKIKSEKEIPIIVITGGGDAKGFEKMSELGVDSFLLKPFTDTKIQNSLFKICDRLLQKRELEEYKRQEELSIVLSSIGKLAAGITHEINTPLTFAKGNLELMKESIDALPDGDAKKNILEGHTVVSDALTRIKNIVESMREIAGKGSGKKEKTDILKTVHMALVMLYSRAKTISEIYCNAKLFTPNIDIREGEYFIFADKQRIEQIWVIIVNNALDELAKQNIPFKERRIDIVITQDTQFVKIAIQDNAGGIPDAIKERLFMPFASTKESSGIGIGLNIAKSIVQEHKGQIAAYNKNGGAVFEIIFERYKDAI